VQLTFNINGVLEFKATTASSKSTRTLFGSALLGLSQKYELDSIKYKPQKFGCLRMQSLRLILMRAKLHTRLEYSLGTLRARSSTKSVSNKLSNTVGISMEGDVEPSYRALFDEEEDEEEEEEDEQAL
jgi:hypothetical protein